MAKDEKQTPEPVETIIRANFNTTININGLGVNQTIAIEQNGPVEKLWPHRLGLALKLKTPAQPADEFDVVPWVNIGTMRIKLVAPDKKG